MRKDKRPTPRSGRGRPLIQGETHPYWGGPSHTLSKGASRGRSQVIAAPDRFATMPPIVVE